MNTQGDGGRVSEPVLSGAESGAQGRRRLAGVRALIALVACCAAMFWAWRVWWDQAHPLQAAARGLGSGDAARRADAVHEVSELGIGRGGEPIRLLIPMLDDGDAGVRAAAAGSLGLLGSNAIGLRIGADDVRAATAALIGRAKDPSARVQAAVTTSLGMIASAAVTPRPTGRNPGVARKDDGPVVDVDAVADALVVALGGADDAVRLAAITGLGALASLGPGGPSPALIQALDDRSATNRAAAAHALAGYRRGLEPAIPPLLRHLEDAEPQVRAACAMAFGGIRPPATGAAVAPEVIAALRTHDRVARENLATLVGRLKADPRTAVPALIAVLREPIDSDVKVSSQSAIDYDTYSGPAHAAARALGEVAPGTPQAGEALAALAEVVRSGPVRRRGTAAEALGAFGPAAASAVPALIALLKETGSARTATVAGGSAAHALGRIAPGTPAADEALAALIAALRDPWIETRAAALRDLPAFGPKAAAALPVIRELKEKDPDPRVRREASTALEKIKP